MRMKKRITWLGLSIIIMVTLTSCAQSKNNSTSHPQEKLTLDKVIELSHRGQDLSWRDFEEYDSTEVGSGLYILRYELEEGYSLLIGGVPEDKPFYIRLVKSDHSDPGIDIRENNVEAFISKKK